MFWNAEDVAAVFWVTVRSVIFTDSTLDVSAKRKAARELPVEPMTI